MNRIANDREILVRYTVLQYIESGGRRDAIDCSRMKKGCDKRIVAVVISGERFGEEMEQ